MKDNQSDAGKFWENGHELLSSGQFLEAAIEFDKAIENGYIDQYVDGTLVLFWAGLARILCNDEKIAKERFAEFLRKSIFFANRAGKFKFERSYEHLKSMSFQLNELRIIEFQKEKGLYYLFSEIIPEFFNAFRKEEALNNRDSILDNDPENITSNLSSLVKLSSLVGLNSVKREVKKLVNVAKIRQIRKDRGLEVTPQSLHMIFTGNPGTGKTTIARIIAEVFYEIGLLSNGHLIEVDRATIVERYVGQTAKKMQEIIESAKGGILFIDEAYSLSTGDDNDFGKEAIDTLVKLMEDNREDLVVIVAGYNDEMGKFLKSNTGLKSRFSYNIHFPDYELDELLIIFKRMCENKGYQLAEGLEEAILKMIEERRAKDEIAFGNARGVRNIFERVEINQMNRLAGKESLTNEDLTTFLKEDCE